MKTIQEILKYSVDKGASDIHLTVGIPPTMRVNGQFIPIGEIRLKAEDTERYMRQILNESQFDLFLKKGELDFSISEHGIGRFRLNVFKQRGTIAAAIRLVASRIPNADELGLPASVVELSKKTRGLILVTGPTGSGKSTTLASLINLINRQRRAHILTLEDPIEYLHKHDKSIVNQREIGHDSQSYTSALKAALRQDPDVILVGEMRDLETIAIALTAAETGHLVLSTLHTVGAAKTIDRVIDIFPPYQQQQVRVQLSTVLQAVISQQLLPCKKRSGRVAAIEVMIANPAIRNMIREGKTHQIASVIQTGLKYGMQTMDHALADLYRKGMISKEDAMLHAVDQEILERMIL